MNTADWAESLLRSGLTIAGVAAVTGLYRLRVEQLADDLAAPRRCKHLGCGSVTTVQHQICDRHREQMVFGPRQRVGLA